MLSFRLKSSNSKGIFVVLAVSLTRLSQFETLLLHQRFLSKETPIKPLIFLASLLISSNVLAQQIRVEKVKGNKAVVEFSGNLTPGKSYTLAGNSALEVSEPSGRNYILGGSLSFSSGTYSVSNINTSVKHTDFTMSTRFGWNLKQYEFGPLLTFRNSDSDFLGLHNSTLTGGGFFDYNFTPNQTGVKSILGITGEASLGSVSSTSGSSTSLLDIFAGGFFKWFGISNSTALRTDLGYRYYKVSNSGGTTGTLQDFELRAAIATYF